MTNNSDTNSRKSEIEAYRMYTQHGQKHLFGYPLRFHGRNALAWWKDGKLLGFSYQDEINAAFNDPDIPEYNPL